MRSRGRDVLAGIVIGCVGCVICLAIYVHRHFYGFGRTLRQIRRLPEFRGHRKEKV